MKIKDERYRTHLNPKLSIMAEFHRLLLDKMLERACRKKSMATIVTLIRHGAKDWEVGLAGACSAGRTKVIKYMIRQGATNFNEGMFVAGLTGHLKTMKYMVKSGADDFDTILYELYRCGKHDALRFMIQHHWYSDDCGQSTAIRNTMKLERFQ